MMTFPQGFGPAATVVATPAAVATFAAPAPQVISPIGFRSRKIGKHKSRTVCARPETFYVPGQLFIPRSVAKHFEIKELRVGGICIIGGHHGIPAELYSNEGCNGPVFIALPALYPGQEIEMRVKNISSKSRRFRAALNGVATLY